MVRRFFTNRALQAAVRFDTMMKMREKRTAGETMYRKSDYIAVFDSGVGGISVLQQLLRVLPKERFLYYGDSANAPYGTRPATQVQELSLAVAEKLYSRGIKALVVACNTATAAAIQTLRSRYPDLIVIGVEPALKVAAERFPGGHVGVMATPCTLEGEKFRHLLGRFQDQCTVSLIPAPGLADLVEAGLQNGPEGQALLQPLLAPYVGKLDALVLGCTHYPFAQEMIQKILGCRTRLIDGGEGTALQTRRALETANLLHDGPGEVVIENSMDSEELLSLCRKLAGIM